MRRQRAPYRFRGDAARCDDLRASRARVGAAHRGGRAARDYPSDPSIAALADRANDYVPALVSDASLPAHLLTAYVDRLTRLTRPPRAGIDAGMARVSR